MRRAGTPAINAKAGTSAVTTAPAAMKAYWPIVWPQTMDEVPDAGAGADLARLVDISRLVQLHARISPRLFGRRRGRSLRLLQGVARPRQHAQNPHPLPAIGARLTAVGAAIEKMPAFEVQRLALVERNRISLGLLRHRHRFAPFDPMRI